MVKLKWFLVGIIVSIVLVDWVRTRLENQELRTTVATHLASSETRNKNVESCISTLNDAKETLQILSLRAQVAAMSRAQALNLYERARSGDDVAIEDLKELGIDVPPLRPQVLAHQQVARNAVFGQK